MTTPTKLGRIIVALLVTFVMGCPKPTPNAPEANIPAAIAFVKETYPGVVVNRIDDTTIGLIWESGAEREFEKLNAKVKADFGVDSRITATE